VGGQENGENRADEGLARQFAGTVLAMGTEWWIVIGVVVLLFGGSQLPKLARSIGQAQKEFKKGLAEGAADDGADKKQSS
jgi:sec-independent protein translocase protein TatA